MMRDRNAAGNPFPTVRINDGSTRNNINFGAEGFSTANLLEQRVLTITDNFEINVGKNKITIGTHNEFAQSKMYFSEITFVLTHFVVLMTSC
jgi:hypothetical protein